MNNYFKCTLVKSPEVRINLLTEQSSQDCKVEIPQRGLLRRPPSPHLSLDPVPARHWMRAATAREHLSPLVL